MFNFFKDKNFVIHIKNVIIKIQKYHEYQIFLETLVIPSSVIFFRSLFVRGESLFFFYHF